MQIYSSLMTIFAIHWLLWLTEGAELIKDIPSNLTEERGDAKEISAVNIAVGQRYDLRAI